MNQQLVDCVCMGVCGGVLAGSWLGYKLRKIVEREKRKRTDRAWVSEKQQPRKRDAVTGVVVDRPRIQRDHASTIERRIEAQQARDVMARSNQVIPITRAKNPTPQTMADHPFAEQVREVDDLLKAEEVRDDVIAALMSSGFRGAAAARAADSCTEADRATVEAWIRAALANAVNARSS